MHMNNDFANAYCMFWCDLCSLGHPKIVVAFSFLMWHMLFVVDWQSLPATDFCFSGSYFRSVIINIKWLLSFKCLNDIMKLTEKGNEFYCSSLSLFFCFCVPSFLFFNDQKVSVKAWLLKLHKCAGKIIVTIY